MMNLDAGAIAQTIQLSVTPVFLLVGTGSLLNVIAGRLARVVDRSRNLMERWSETEGVEHDRIVKAILSGESEEAAAALRAHVAVQGDRFFRSGSTAH